MSYTKYVIHKKYVIHNFLAFLCKATKRRGILKNFFVKKGQLNRIYTLSDYERSWVSN